LTVYEDEPQFGDIYDRKNEPDELNNLWFEDNFQNKRCELIDTLMHESLKALSRYPKRMAGS
jgi:hypothetical protein